MFGKYTSWAFVLSSLSLIRPFSPTRAAHNKNELTVKSNGEYDLSKPYVHHYGRDGGHSTYSHAVDKIMIPIALILLVVAVAICFLGMM